MSIGIWHSRLKPEPNKHSDLAPSPGSSGGERSHISAPESPIALKFLTSQFPSNSLSIRPNNTMSRLFDISKDVAVVIGATGSLGGSIAEGLAAAGAQVAILGRNAERGEGRADSIRRAGGRSTFFATDAADRASLAVTHAKICEELGAPTILVNAAGGNDPRVTVTSDRPFEAIQIADWQANFDLNLVGGALLPCQEFGPGMVSRLRGSIINIASVSAHLPLSRVVGYSAAKAAVMSLTRFLAREWAPHGVRVNSITPGLAKFNPRNRTHTEELIKGSGRAIIVELK